MVCLRNFISNVCRFLDRYLNNNQLTTLPRGVFSTNTALQTLWVVESDCVVCTYAISHLILLFRFLIGILITINWQHNHAVYLAQTRRCINCAWWKVIVCVIYICHCTSHAFFFYLKSIRCTMTCTNHTNNSVLVLTIDSMPCCC